MLNVLRACRVLQPFSTYPCRVEHRTLFPLLVAFSEDTGHSSRPVSQLHALLRRLWWKHQHANQQQGALPVRQKKKLKLTSKYPPRRSGTQVSAYLRLSPSEGSEDTVLQDQDNAELISALVRPGPPGGSRELREPDQQSASRD